MLIGWIFYVNKLNSTNFHDPEIYKGTCYILRCLDHLARESLRIYRESQKFLYKLGGKEENIERNHIYKGKHKGHQASSQGQNVWLSHFRRRLHAINLNHTESITLRIQPQAAKQNFTVDVYRGGQFSEATSTGSPYVSRLYSGGSTAHE